MKKQWHLFLFGRVQGVGLRYVVCREADKYGLTGFVRNQADGSVEIVVFGEEEVLKRFFRLLRAHPGQAAISRIEQREEVPLTRFDRFEILY